jgi:hypothetical protein
LSTTRLINCEAVRPNSLQRFGFLFARRLARFVQDTDRSVSYPQGENR